MTSGALDPRRWREGWDDWWFPSDTGFRLAVCRILVVSAQLFFFMPSVSRQVDLIENNATGFIDPQWLVVAISAVGLRDVLLAPAFFEVLYVVTFVAGIACLVGLLTRPAAFVFALGNWIFVSHTYSYGEEHHGEAIICMFLMLLAFSPSGRRLSLDAVLHRWRGGEVTAPATVETAVWPLRLTQLLLAWAYFSNGLSKLVYGGLEWMNGYTLQRHILGNAVSWDKPLGLELARHHELAVLLSIGTIVIELFFPLAVFVRRTTPFFLIGGALLHVGIDVTMGAAFYQHVVLYSVFIDFSKWETRLLSRPSIRGSTGLEPASP